MKNFCSRCSFNFPTEICLEKHFSDFKHLWVNHKICFVDPLNKKVLVLASNTNHIQVHTQGIEATWGALKRSMKHLYGTVERNVPGYLTQYMFRKFQERADVRKNTYRATKRMGSLPVIFFSNCTHSLYFYLIFSLPPILPRPAHSTSFAVKRFS